MICLVIFVTTYIAGHIFGRRAGLWVQDRLQRLFAVRACRTQPMDDTSSH
ncbi:MULTISPECIES: hypothetical protein [unclassified Thioalkalivibrio]|nr:MULTISPECIES: hypothetical protein [unclassified Thioalkalivibrio]